jgi:hypothetical protein
MSGPGAGGAGIYAERGRVPAVAAGSALSLTSHPFLLKQGYLFRGLASDISGNVVAARYYRTQELVICSEREENRQYQRHHPRVP